MPLIAKTSTILQMHTAILGTDFHNVSLDILEKLHFDKNRIKAFHDSLPEDAPVLEWVILSTCNRMEIYFACEDVESTFIWLIQYLANYCGVSESILYSVTYKMNCHDAVNHLFHVAAGTESMVYGETEILGQIKDAYFYSAACEMTGPYMNKLYQSAIAAGKRVREETNISKGALSISSIAIEAMRKKTGSDTSVSILLIGAGTMTVRALKKLRSLQYNSLYICNRTQTKAESLADEFEINVVPINQLKDMMKKVDVIYCATNTSEPIITTEDASQLSKQTLLIDVGVPRNVAADCAKYCTLISIDQLEAVAKETVDKRASDKDKIDSILEDEKSVFLNWYAYKQVHS